MADVHSPEIRSYNMSKIKGKNTKPELIVRKFIFNAGLRYRLHVKNLPGKPDIVLPKYKTVIFVHGCFWHGHEGCRYFTVPMTRTQYWLNKIHINKKRDEENYSRLITEGWKVLTIFECELMSANQSKTLTRLIENLKKIPTTKKND
jgi:DNA mismatch endonuclease (patch repair protein)